MSHTDQPAQPATPRFQILAASRKSVNYVLRDNESNADYPFKTLKTARAAVALRRRGGFLSGQLFGSPIDSDAYMVSGPVLEQFDA